MSGSYMAEKSLILGLIVCIFNPSDKLFSVDSVITNHVHLYDFSTQAWHSTFNSSSADISLQQPLVKFRVARTNHACVQYQEDGRTKVMIAGGVIKENGVRKTTNSTEILDLQTMTWTFGHYLPQTVTGSKLVNLRGRPLLLGR